MDRYAPEFLVVRKERPKYAAFEGSRLVWKENWLEGELFEEASAERAQARVKECSADDTELMTFSEAVVSDPL